MARRNSYRGKYKMTKEQYLAAKYYALRYHEWQTEYRALTDTARGITYSDMPKGSLSTASPVEEAAIKCQAISDKIRLIEDTAAEAGGDLSRYLIKAVTNSDITFHQMKVLTDMPCGRDLFYNMVRRFYFLLSQKI